VILRVWNIYDFFIKVNIYCCRRRRRRRRRRRLFCFTPSSIDLYGYISIIIIIIIRAFYYIFCNFSGTISHKISFSAQEQFIQQLVIC